MQDFDDDGLDISKHDLESKLAHHQQTVSYYAADLERQDLRSLQGFENVTLDEDELKQLEASIEAVPVNEPEFAEMFRLAEASRAKIASISHDLINMAHKVANSNTEAREKVRKQHEHFLDQISALKGALQVPSHRRSQQAYARCHSTTPVIYDAVLRRRSAMCRSPEHSRGVNDHASL